MRMRGRCLWKQAPQTNAGGLPTASLGGHDWIHATGPPADIQMSAGNFEAG